MDEYTCRIFFSLKHHAFFMSEMRYLPTPVMIFDVKEAYENDIDVSMAQRRCAALLLQSWREQKRKPKVTLSTADTFRIELFFHFKRWGYSECKEFIRARLGTCLPESSLLYFISSVPTPLVDYILARPYATKWYVFLNRNSVMQSTTPLVDHQHGDIIHQAIVTASPAKSE